ncbi:MAG: hypothetical protein R3248_04715 [Candidatus Promineifilaceae bacterium]|nr:hypothetical protein [Candidatus Promineifilaceae bacterium]
MLKIAFGLFLILHGAVHFLYLGQSAGAFELQPGLRWPAGSWAFAALLEDGVTRWVASAAMVLAAVAFAAGGLGLFLRQSWWQPTVVGAAVFSSVLFILLWDGGWQRLDDKGGVGLLLNLALLLALLAFSWPQFDV